MYNGSASFQSRLERVALPYRISHVSNEHNVYCSLSEVVEAWQERTAEHRPEQRASRLSVDCRWSTFNEPLTRRFETLGKTQSKQRCICHQNVIRT